MNQERATQITPVEYWVTVLGESSGAVAHSALSMIRLLNPEAIAEGIDRLNHLETIGPMIDPTAWLDGRLWRNSKQLRDVLEKLLTLRRALE